ncbi:MAG: hypothetical protein HXO16_01880 [Prevotella salivae]|uniref:Uncharacterized protein n=1 Tax=Siphoviridae sp. ctnsL8 TaxID=2825666 RepID=A0A8S5PPE0_9CAUD|nr:hypothetical protein [Segatella salivae]DAE08297.1 MAG TPA: protein of unknown function (DUF5351) [Siphoviridae sp. ctnsL8]
MKIKNEAELLSMFCDKSYSNPLRSNPFFNMKCNEVWGTDGYVLIRIKPERLVGEYPKGELNLPPLECPCKKKITIEAINKALGECPKVDEEIIIQDAIECKECDGSGEVYWEYTDNNCYTHEHLDECPVCNGTGELEPEKTKKTGRQITKEDAVINIGNGYFFAKNICKLKSAMDFLDITSVELIYNHYRNASEFVIDEDIRIELAPMSFDHTYECDAKLELI